MADPVETGFDVAFQHPDRRVAFGQCTEALADGVGAGSAFSKPVGVPVAKSLGDGFQSQRVERLHGAIQHGGNGERAQLAVLLGDVVPAKGSGR